MQEYNTKNKKYGGDNMRKIILIVFCLLISFSAVYGDETSNTFQFTEIKPLENPSEDDYTGVWIPFVEYLRPYKDVIVLDEFYQDNFIVVYDKEVLVKTITNKNHLIFTRFS